MISGAKPNRGTRFDPVDDLLQALCWPSLNFLQGCGSVCGFRFEPTPGPRTGCSGPTTVTPLWGPPTMRGSVWHTDTGHCCGPIEGEWLDLPLTDAMTARRWRSSYELAAQLGPPGFRNAPLSFWRTIHVEPSRSRREVLISGEDGTARLYDDSGHRILDLEPPSAPVSHLGLSADGLHIFTASSGRWLCLWDVRSGRRVTERQVELDGAPVLE